MADQPRVPNLFRCVRHHSPPRRDKLSRSLNVMTRFFFGLPRRSPAFDVAARFGGTFALSGSSSNPADLKGDCQERFGKLHVRYTKGKYASAKLGCGDFLVTCVGT